MAARRLAVVAMLALLAGGAQAGDRAVYKNVDASGQVTYSDRRSDGQDARVKNWMPSASGDAYYEATHRAEADRAYYARQQYERRVPPPVAVYDPRRWQTQR